MTSQILWRTRLLAGFTAVWLAPFAGLLSGARAAEGSGPEPMATDYQRITEERFLWMDELENGSLVTAREQMQIKLVLDDRLQTKENLYLAASYYSNFLLDSTQHSQVLSICRQYPPKPDHYRYQAICILGENQPIIEASRKLEAIADTALKHSSDRLTVTTILNAAATRLSDKGHAHESIRLFKRIFELLPAEAENDIAESKVNMAFSYANPLLSEPMQRQAIRYYDEVIDWYKKQKTTPYSIEQVKWVSYNKAIAQIFLFAEYDKALEALDEAEGSESLSTDIKVFKAYALAKNNQGPAARQVLEMVDLRDYDVPDRIAFLTCYVDLTRRLLGDATSLQTCLNLKAPQIDVLLDLTATLSQLGLDPLEENKMWRTFYLFFSEHLKPDFQNSMATAASEAELQQEKAESRLKDLKLKNLSLYQELSYAMIAVAIVCGLALFLAIRSWRNSRHHALEMSGEKARLQYIIDSIEEGLIVIRPGLILEPEISRHLQSITGQEDLRGKNVRELLALTKLAADIQAIAIQCLEAIIGESELAWELNQSNLPAEAHLADRKIAFYWQPLLDQGRVQSVLLVLRDVTTLHILEMQSKKAREQADTMLEYAREILSSHPRAVASFLGDLPQLMQELSRNILLVNDFSEARRLAHRLKGTARTLRLHDIQNQAHKVEDELRAGNEAKLRPLLDELNELAQTYTAAMQHVLGPLSDIEVRSLFDLVAQHRLALERQLAAAGVLLGNLTVDESTSLSRAELQPLAEVILHALTNAADHGFIIPKSLGREVPVARFAISVFHDNDERVMIVRDNGVGIDHRKIQEEAAKRAWKPVAGQIWSDFLFLEGVTTANTLTISSGRGVGLAAIHRVVTSMNGRVQLLDNDLGSGSMLRIAWPAAQDMAA